MAINSKCAKKISDYLIAGVFVIVASAMFLTWLILPKIGVADARISIYGNQFIDIERVNYLMARSPVKGNQSVHLFIVPRWVMFLTNPIVSLRGAKGFNVVSANLVFINENSASITDRTLEGVIAHEVTHTDIIQNFGLGTLFYKSWRIEGICDFVSGETSIFAKDQASLLNKYRNNEELTEPENYFIYKLKVQSLVDSGISPSDILSKDIPEPSI